MYKWIVDIPLPASGQFTAFASFMYNIKASGFVIARLPSRKVRYILQHADKHAMTMHMLKYDCTGFVVIEEPVDV
jgi:hypothetical protein